MMATATLLTLEALYAEHRRFLWSLCYRMLGSATEAEDVVHDTFVRAMERPPQRLGDPVRPWLVKVAINLARDALRRRRRREYVGPWLPSPVDTGEDQAAPSHEPVVDGIRTLEGRYDLLESVSFAFLLALEALTPSQRAVLLLRDVFDYSVRETATALDVSESNVKTTHHRARRAMAAYHGRRRVPTTAVQETTRAQLAAFLQRLADRDMRGIEALLAENVRLITDGGGEFRSALRPIIGRDKVTRFYMAAAERAPDMRLRWPMLNGMAGVVVDVPAPKPGLAPRLAVMVDLDHDGKIACIYIVSATAKLTAIN